MVSPADAELSTLTELAPTVFGRAQVLLVMINMHFSGGLLKVINWNIAQPGVEKHDVQQEFMSASSVKARSWVVGS